MSGLQTATVPSGVYHPTHIGDKFHNNDKYVVVNKLGATEPAPQFGLLRNTLIDGKDVALKILNGRMPQIQLNEHNIRAHLLQSKKNPQRPGHASLRWFYVSGPNGYHLYLVSEVVGCNLQKYQSARIVKLGLPTWTFPIKASRAIAASGHF